MELRRCKRVLFDSESKISDNQVSLHKFSAECGTGEELLKNLLSAQASFHMFPWLLVFVGFFWLVFMCVVLMWCTQTLADPKHKRTGRGFENRKD